MTKETDQLFQERVDELLLLEQRIERRAEKFLELTREHQEKSQRAVKDLVGKVAGVDESLKKIDAASARVESYMTQCATQALRTSQLFLGTVVACVLILGGSLWWSHHINRDLAAANAELARLNIHLKHKPVIALFHGQDYVRVVPDSETGFTRGDDSEVTGRYSAVWHVRTF